MALLLPEFNDGSSPQCGGTLIDPDSVLTAAHCVAQPQKKLLRVGVYVGGTVRGQDVGWQDRSATAAPIHPKYKPGMSFNYDVAVLKLNQAVTGIKPIKLNNATQAGIALETPPRVLTAAGWGTTSSLGTSGSNQLREVSLRVIYDVHAQKAWSTQPSAFHYTPSLMVATDSQEGKDIAQGDSGGPLFNPGATPTQVGIISYNHRSTAPDSRPSAYTDINDSEITAFIANAKR